MLHLYVYVFVLMNEMDLKRGLAGYILDSRFKILNKSVFSLKTKKNAIFASSAISLYFFMTV